MLYQLTVVIPTKNRRDLLLRAVRSVMAQRGVDVQVIVVDDGGEDGTPAAVRSLADTRITVIRHETSLGQAVARNAGLSVVETQWVGFLDDDDLWAPDKARSAIAAMEAAGSGWSCSGAANVDESFRVLFWHRPPVSGAVEAQVLAKDTVPAGGSGVIASTELTRQVGGFDEALRILSDWDMWIRLAAASPLSTIDRPDVAYVLHGGGISLDLPRVEEEYLYLKVKHERARRRLRTDLDGDSWNHYVASLALRSGRKTQGGLLMLQEFVHYRRPRALLQLAVALLPIDLRLLRELRARKRQPRGWLSYFRSWVTEAER